MIYVFDLDGTLLTEEKGNYSAAAPITERVDQVRELYKDHTIVIQTARSYIWEDFTLSQLDNFGIPYHAVSVGSKVYGDVYVDDKAVNDKDFFK